MSYAATISVKLAVGSNFVRFGLENKQGTVMDNLKKKLYEYDTHLPVYYLDRDNDWCVINKEDELIHAFTYLGLIRGQYFIKLHPRPSTSTPNGSSNALTPD